MELAIGTTSSTSGKITPSLHTGFGWGDSFLTLFSTGTSTELYYQSTYGLSYYKKWTSAEFMFAPLQTYFGVGGTFSVYGFRDYGSTTEETANDLTLGPAFRAQWQLTSMLYLSIEAIWGIRSLDRHLLLHFQDTTTLSFGVNF